MYFLTRLTVILLLEPFQGTFQFPLSTGIDRYPFHREVLKGVPRRHEGGVFSDAKKLEVWAIFMPRRACAEGIR